MPTEHNLHAAWRLEQARAVAERLRRFPGLLSISVGGSVGRGTADAWSDIEMPLFWEAQPPNAVRQEIAAVLGADSLNFSTRPAGEDNFIISGFQVDLWHIAVSEAEAIFEEVLVRHNPDLKLSNFIDTLHICRPFTGEPVLRRLQQMSQGYPPALAERVITAQLGQLRAKHLELYLIRQNPTLLYGTITHLQQTIFLILLALNGSHFPAFKWMYHRLAALPLKPANIEQRLRHTFACPPAEAIAETRQLIAETLALVNERLPHLDITATREDLAFSRMAHEQPVHLFK